MTQPVLDTGRVAEPRKHVHEFQVRFGDIDSLGHVNNCRYLTYLEDNSDSTITGLRTGVGQSGHGARTGRQRAHPPVPPGARLRTGQPDGASRGTLRSPVPRPQTSASLGQPRSPGAAGPLRAAAGRHADDPGFTSLADELSSLSPEFANWWRRHDVLASSSGTKTMRDPQRGVVTFDHTVLKIADATDQHLVVYTRGTVEGTSRGGAARHDSLPQG